MRYTIASAAVASAAAAASLLIAAGPASAAAPSSTASSPVSISNNPYNASPAQYATVAVGQTESQVQQEMGSAGSQQAIDTHHVPNSTGFSLTWTDNTSALGLRSFVVDFTSVDNATPTVSSKDIDPVTLPQFSL